ARAANPDANHSATADEARVATERIAHCESGRARLFADNSRAAPDIVDNADADASQRRAIARRSAPSGRRGGIRLHAGAVERTHRGRRRAASAGCVLAARDQPQRLHLHLATDWSATGRAAHAESYPRE